MKITRCDICGVNEAVHWDVTKQWKQGMPIEEQEWTIVEIRHGAKTVECADMCPECFRTRLIPWINSQRSVK
jgi:hypothetical protein